MMASYNLRRGVQKNNKELENIKLPRLTRVRAEKDKLYSVTVLKENGDKVKIHYKGYDEEYDEWRNRDEPAPTELYKQFELHQEVAMQIKLALNSKNRTDPDVCIEVHLINYFLRGDWSKPEAS